MSWEMKFLLRKKYSPGETLLTLCLAIAIVSGCIRQEPPSAPSAPVPPAPWPLKQSQSPAAAELEEEPQESRPILCYAGPSMKRSMEELAETFEKRTGVKVTVEANDPRSLIDKISFSPEVGLFVSHDPFLQMLTRQGASVRQSWCVASLTPVIAVVKGNPKQIEGLADLAKPGIRVGLTAEESAISAHIMALILKKSGLKDAVEANVVLRTAAGRFLVTALAEDKIDAGVVWNAVAYGNRDKIEPVEIAAKWRPERGVDATVDSPTLGRLELDYVRVTVAELAICPRPEAVHAFCEFVASPEGMAVFKKNGFSPADPDRPVLLPENEKPVAE
jgi:molybdate transport system substrate-binding protein